MAAKCMKKRPLLEMLYFGVLYCLGLKSVLFVEKSESVESSWGQQLISVSKFTVLFV